jgi:Transposase
MRKDDKEVSTSGLVDTSPAVAAKRRRWPEALKREMVAATFEPGSSVSIVARRLRRERQPIVQMAPSVRCPAGRAGNEPVRLVPVEIAAAPPATSGRLVMDGTARAPGLAVPPPAVTPGSIEIEPGEAAGSRSPGRWIRPS